MKHVIIIGGGIAGLTTAYYLKKKGINVTLVERKSYVGGVITSVFKKERYILEYGPNTFLGSSDPIQSLSRELGIDQQIVENNSKKRYIYRKSKLHLVPTGPKDFICSKLISRKGKLRIFLESFIRSKSDDTESLASFATRRGGKELMEAFVDPFVSGVWAGNPQELEVKSVFPKLLDIERKHGSIIKGMRELKSGVGENALMSYKWGMETLPARIYDLMKSSIHVNTTVNSIKLLPNGKWSVSPGFTADAVVLATPAAETARLLVPHLPDIFSPLMAIPYVSLVVVHTAFKQNDIPMSLEGFGFLVPRTENIRMLGSIWSSALFPHRAPAGEVLLTNFIGGSSDSNVVGLEDHEILDHVIYGLEKTMGIKKEPVFYNVKRVIQAIPQYTIGHANRLAEIQKNLENLPGVYLTGSYFSGISVSDTIAHAKEVASLIS